MILLATRSISLRDGLLALLAAITPGHTIEFAGDVTEVARQLGESPADLVVLDADLLDGAAGMVVRQIKQVSSVTRLLLLTDTVRQQQAMAQLEAGAVLLKGTSAAEIADAIERLLGASSTLTE